MLPKEFSGLNFLTTPFMDFSTSMLPRGHNCMVIAFLAHHSSVEPSLQTACSQESTVVGTIPVRVKGVFWRCHSENAVCRKMSKDFQILKSEASRKNKQNISRSLSSGGNLGFAQAQYGSSSVRAGSRILASRSSHSTCLLSCSLDTTCACESAIKMAPCL